MKNPNHLESFENESEFRMSLSQGSHIPDTREKMNAILVREADIARWKEGARIFHELCDKLSPREWTQFINSYSGEMDLSDLQSVLLGEKPLGDHINPPSAHYQSLLEENGIVVSNTYLYRPSDIAAAVERYPYVFKEISPSPTPENIVHFLESRGEITRENEQVLIQGVLYGYPFPEVEQYAKMESLPCVSAIHRLLMHLFQNIETPTSDEKLFVQINLDIPPGPDRRQYVSFCLEMIEKNRSLFPEIDDRNMETIAGSMESYLTTVRTAGGAHGFVWATFDSPSPESVEKTERIKLAFETSGILEIQPPFPEQGKVSTSVPNKLP